MKRTIVAIALAAAMALPMAASADTSLTAVGSTALLPLVKQSATDYQTKHPDVHISVSGGGSQTGISQAAAGAADIGDSDIMAPAGSGLTDHKVAVVGFAVITNPEVGVKNLTTEQVRGIFAGQVKNWKEVGGKDQAIVVINRPRSSGTRAVFTKTFMGNEKVDEAGLVEDSSGTVATTVVSTPGSISYVAFGYWETTKVVAPSIDSVSPNADNVRGGKWKFWSYEHMFTKGAGKPEAEDFIKFVADNKDAVEKLGYILISSMKVSETDR